MGPGPEVWGVYLSTVCVAEIPSGMLSTLGKSRKTALFIHKMFRALELKFLRPPMAYR